MRYVAVLTCTLLLAACQATQPKPPTVEGNFRRPVNSGETAAVLAMRAELAAALARLRAVEQQAAVEAAAVVPVVKASADVPPPALAAASAPATLAQATPASARKPVPRPASAPQAVPTPAPTPAPIAAPAAAAASAVALPEPAPRVVAVEAPAVEQPKPVVSPEWIVASNSRVRATLENWSRSAGWAVLWQPSDVDYTSGGGATFKGDFKKAVGDLFDAIPFETLEPAKRVRVQLRPNNTPPLVLVTRDDGVTQ